MGWTSTPPTAGGAARDRWESLTALVALADEHADMDVPGVAFGKGLQPSQLTPLTYGVIADVKERIVSLGAEVVPTTPEGMDKFNLGQIALWGKVVKASGAKVD